MGSFTPCSILGTIVYNKVMIENVSIFDGMDQSDIALIEQRMVRRTFPKNTIILSEGDNSDSLYVIVSGRVKVYLNDENGKEAIISRNTIIGTPLYDAGLDRGDQVIAIDRLKITSERRWEDAIGRYEPGDTATIRFLQRGVERSEEITFEADPAVEVVTFEAAGRNPSAEQLAFREAWLGQ